MAMTEADYSKLSKAEVVELLKKAEERRARNDKLAFKVGAKGGVSVSGLGQRFPTTLYKASWLKLLDHADELRAFIKAHESELAADKE